MELTEGSAEGEALTQKETATEISQKSILETVVFNVFIYVLGIEAKVRKHHLEDRKVLLIIVKELNDLESRSNRMKFIKCKGIL